MSNPVLWLDPARLRPAALQSMSALGLFGASVAPPPISASISPQTEYRRFCLLEGGATPLSTNNTHYDSKA